MPMSPDVTGTDRRGSRGQTCMKGKLKFHRQAPLGLLPCGQGPAGSRIPGSGNVIAVRGAAGEGFNVGGRVGVRGIFTC